MRFFVFSLGYIGMQTGLYIVATPIGNLKDITFRAVEILSSVDAIYCEDTRTTKKLCQAYDIQTPLRSFHSYSSSGAVDAIVQDLKNGKSYAYVSDAGTPGISDPSFVLKQACASAEIEVYPIPGASAVITALQALPAHTHAFTYLGFLPVKKGRKTLFESLQTRDHTTVFYESPHRIQKTLRDIALYLGDETMVSLGREMTKLHESYVTGTVEEMLEYCASPRGEYTVIIHKT